MLFDWEPCGRFYSHPDCIAMCLLSVAWVLSFICQYFGIIMIQIDKHEIFSSSALLVFQCYEVRMYKTEVQANFSNKYSVEIDKLELDKD